MEVVNCENEQSKKELHELNTLRDCADLDNIFNGMLQDRYGMSLDEMLAWAELARKFEARPISQLPMDQRMYLFGGKARITCTKCHRQFIEPILQPWVRRPDGKVVLCRPVDVYGCSKCTPAKPQPQEGDTFHPERRKARGRFITVGRDDRGHRDRLRFDGDNIRVTGARDLTDESLSKDSLKSWGFQQQVQENTESQFRESLLTPGNIETAQIAFSGQTIREIQRRYDLTYHTARSGANKLSELAVPGSNLSAPG
jgi:hypothetical protein